MTLRGEPIDEGKIWSACPECRGKEERMNICGYADCPGDDREAGTSCARCAEEWTRILAELTRLRAIVARVEDVEGMAAIICCDVCQSPETPDDLWESVPNSVKGGWRGTAIAVRDHLLGRG